MRCLTAQVVHHSQIAIYMASKGRKRRRFAVALSFPGEHRRFVRNVAKRLAAELGEHRVFYDEWYESELSGIDADLKLRSVYRDDAELVIPFFSQHYEKPWCQIEWSAIRALLAERRKEDAVVPVHLDVTKVPGWESIDLGIRRGRQTAAEIAARIAAVYWHRAGNRASSNEVVECLNVLMMKGTLRKSLLAEVVLTAVRGERALSLAKNFDATLLLRGIRDSDERYVRIQLEAGMRDWQRDVASTTVPVLTALGKCLSRCAAAQLVVLRTYELVAKRMRLRLVWPTEPDAYNDVANAIYTACVAAQDLESDDVLAALMRVPVKGPT